MLKEWTRLLSNACVNSKLVKTRDLVLTTKITNSATDGKSVDALMIHLVGVQIDEELGIQETHHSSVVLEMFKVYAWDSSGMETIELTKLLDTMVLEIESKYRQHLDAVKKAQELDNLVESTPGLVKNPEIKKI